MASPKKSVDSLTHALKIFERTGMTREVAQARTLLRTARDLSPKPSSAGDPGHTRKAKGSSSSKKRSNTPSSSRKTSSVKKPPKKKKKKKK